MSPLFLDPVDRIQIRSFRLGASSNLFEGEDKRGYIEGQFLRRIMRKGSPYSSDGEDEEDEEDDGV